MDMSTELPRQYIWPSDDPNRIPDWVYTDPWVYEREVERIFHGRTWNYVAPGSRNPKAGDFIRSNVGPTPVVVARDERRRRSPCSRTVAAHRAAEFCRELTGNVKAFVCPYHQWTYDLQRQPCRRCRSVAVWQVRAGWANDFQLAEHNPRQLTVTTHRGVMFASYAHDMESLAGLSWARGAARIRGHLRRPQAVTSSAITGTACRATGSCTTRT